MLPSLCLVSALIFKNYQSLLCDKGRFKSVWKMCEIWLIFLPCVCVCVISPLIQAMSDRWIYVWLRVWGIGKKGAVAFRAACREGVRLEAVVNGSLVQAQAHWDKAGCNDCKKHPDLAFKRHRKEMIYRWFLINLMCVYVRVCACVWW